MKHLIKAAAVALTLLATNASAGVLTGGTVGMIRYGPDLGTPIQDYGTAVVGAGTEFVTGGGFSHEFDLDATRWTSVL